MKASNAVKGGNRRIHPRVFCVCLMSNMPEISACDNPRYLGERENQLAAAHAIFAIMASIFALAIFLLRVHKEPAFQASSPKTFTGQLRLALFLSVAARFFISGRMRAR
jgi:hypothetical protein